MAEPTLDELAKAARSGRARDVERFALSWVPGQPAMPHPLVELTWVLVLRTIPGFLMGLQV